MSLGLVDGWRNVRLDEQPGVLRHRLLLGEPEVDERPQVCGAVVHAPLYLLRRKVRHQVSCTSRLPPERRGRGGCGTGPASEWWRQFGGTPGHPDHPAAPGDCSRPGRSARTCRRARPSLAGLAGLAGRCRPSGRPGPRRTGRPHPQHPWGQANRQRMRRLRRRRRGCRSGQQGQSGR